MRHNNKYNHLGRKTGHRKALLSNMASSLILSKRIETTLAKAKALRMFAEPIITVAKDDTTHARREAFSALKNKYAVKELFGVVAEKVGNRPGGYTRILKLGFRHGDAAEMALIELVDFNETYVATPKKDAKKKTTRRAGKTAAPKAEVAPKVAETAPVAEQAPEVVETPATE